MLVAIQDDGAYRGMLFVEPTYREFAGAIVVTASRPARYQGTNGIGRVTLHEEPRPARLAVRQRRWRRWRWSSRPRNSPFWVMLAGAAGFLVLTLAVIVLPTVPGDEAARNWLLGLATPAVVATDRG